MIWSIVLGVALGTFVAWVALLVGTVWVLEVRGPKDWRGMG